MPKKGARFITVDGERYRWRVRSTGTYAQGNAWNPLTASIELADEPGRVLVASFNAPRPDNWIGIAGHVALPSEIAAAIRCAIAQGYDPRSAGGPHLLAAQPTRAAPAVGESAGLTLATDYGVRLDLSIVGYQYEARSQDSLNWLIISGQIAHPQGDWIFRDPALETGEAAELCDWLKRTAEEPRRVHPPLAFTEPNLSFRHRVEGEAASLVVCLAHECAPPWLGTREERLQGIDLEFALDGNDLGQSAESLKRQVQHFPTRDLSS